MVQDSTSGSLSQSIQTASIHYHSLHSISLIQPITFKTQTMKSSIALALAAASTTLAATIPLPNGAYYTNETIVKRDDQICVQVQSTISTWYYRFEGVWGTDAGQGPSFAGSFCVPANDGAGGALYVGPTVSRST